MKKILTAIFALAATFALVSCGNKKNVVHIGYYTGDLCNAPMHIAMEKGFFEEEFKKAGVEFDYISRVQANANTGELIASGKMDAGTDLAAAILPSMENGLKITYVLGFHTGCTKFYVRQDSGINSVEDLKGKKVAIPGLQDTAYMNLRRKLESVGIKTSQEDGEVEFIVYDQTSIPIALDKGNVDVIGIHDPVARISDVPELQDALKATNNDFVAATNLLKQHIRGRLSGGGRKRGNCGNNPRNLRLHSRAE